MGGGSKKQTVGYKYYLGIQMVLCSGKADRLHLVRLGEKEIGGSLFVEKELSRWFGGELNGFDYLAYLIATDGGSAPTGANSYVYPPENLAGQDMPNLAGLEEFNIGCTLLYDRPTLFGGKNAEGGASGTIRTYGGEPFQLPDDYLVSKVEAPWGIPAYRGVTSVVMPKNYIGNTSYVKPIDFVLSRICTKIDYSEQWYLTKAVINGYDMNPAHIVLEVLTDKEWGANTPLTMINYDSFIQVADTLYDEGLGLSFLVNDEAKIEDFLSDVLTHIGGVLRIGRDTGQVEIKLLRDDFDIEVIPHFDENSILKIKDFKRPALSELPNAVLVTYWDLALLEQSTYKVYDPAAIAVQGGEILKEVTLTGVTNRKLAAQIANRIIAEESTPLAAMKVEMDRSAAGLNVGDPIAISHKKYDLVKAAFRIVDIKEEAFGNGKVTLSVVQDVFSFYNMDVGVESFDILKPSEDTPVRIEHFDLVELPYALALQVLSAEVLAGEELENSGLVATLAVLPQQQSTGYIVSTVEGGSQDLTQFDYTPTIILNHDLGVASTVFTASYNPFEFPFSFDDLLGGGDTYNGIGYIDGEFVSVSYNHITGEGVLFRGGFDTEPKTHLSGTRIYLISVDDPYGLLEESFVDGEVVKGWFQTVTSLGALLQPASPSTQITVQAKHTLPNPPRNVTLDNWSFNERVDYNLDGYSLRWVASDKLIEDHQIVNWYTTSGTKDANATYTVELFDSNGVSIFYDDTLTVESVLLPVLDKGAEYTLTLNTVLNGVESLTFENEFKVRPETSPVRNITAAESSFLNYSELGNYTTSDPTYFDPTKTNKALDLATATAPTLAGYTILNTPSEWGEVLVFEFKTNVSGNVHPDKLVLANSVGDKVIGFGVIDGVPCIDLFLGSEVSTRVFSETTHADTTDLKFIFDPYKKYIFFYVAGELVSGVSVGEELLRFAHRVAYGDEIDRIYYYSGDSSVVAAYISEINLTTYGEFLAVDATRDLIQNGYAEAGLSFWDLNPDRELVLASEVYSGLAPSEGSYMFRFDADGSESDNVWMEQYVTERRIKSKYGLGLSRLSLLGAFDLKVTWTQGRHTGIAFGVDVEIEQFDSSDASLGTTTSTTFVNAATDVMEPFEFLVPVNANAESFKLRFTGVPQSGYTYPSLDEIKVEVVDGVGSPPPTLEEISAATVSNYGSFSFLSSPNTKVASSGALSFHTPPETVTSSFGLASFVTQIYGRMEISNVGTFSFHSSPETLTSVVGFVSFYSPYLAEMVNFGIASFHDEIPTAFEPTELLVNRGFETGDLTGWTNLSAYGVVATSVVSQSEAYEGSYFFGYGEYNKEPMHLYQEIVLSGKALQLVQEGKAYLDNSAAISTTRTNTGTQTPDKGWMVISYYDGYGQLIDTVNTFETSGLANYPYWLEMPRATSMVPTNTRKVRLDLKHRRTSNYYGSYAFDDISLDLRETTPFGNLVSNGSFENGVTGWTITGDGYEVATQNSQGVPALEGTNFLAITGESTTIRQLIDPTPTGMAWTDIFRGYYVSVNLATINMSQNSSYSNGGVEVRFILTDNTGLKHVYSYDGALPDSDSEWRKFFVAIQDKFSTTQLELEIVINRGGTSGYIAVDDICLQLMERPLDVEPEMTLSTYNVVTFAKEPAELTVNSLNAVTFVKTTNTEQVEVSSLNAVTFVKPLP